MKSKSPSPITKTIKVDVTFTNTSSAAEAVPVADADAGAILHNIELSHLPDWKVEQCRIVVDDDTKKDSTRHLSTRAILRHLVIGFIICFLWSTITSVVSTNNDDTPILDLIKGGTSSSLLLFSSPLPPLLSKKTASKSKSQTLNNHKQQYKSLIRVHDSISKTTNSLTRRKFQNVPSGYQKTFAYDKKRQSHPLIRVLRQRGWKESIDASKAQLIYTHYPSFSTYQNILHRYQRYNFLPGYKKFCYVYDKIYYTKNYERRVDKQTRYNFESYLITSLSSKEDIQRNTDLEFRDLKTFHQTYITSDDKDSPYYNSYWVLKFADNNKLPSIVGRSNHTLFQKLTEKAKEYYDDGLQPQPPLNTNYLLPTILETIPQNQYTSALWEYQQQLQQHPNTDGDGLYVQKYICRPLLFERSTFKIRSYWFIACTNPLIIFYHDGFIQLEAQSNEQHHQQQPDDELINIINGDDDNIRQHHYQLGSKIPFDKFAKSLNEQYDDKYSSKPRTFPIGTVRPSSSSPSQHIRNQMKDSTGEMIQVYYTESFNGGGPSPGGKMDNTYNIFCNDYVVDEMLNVRYMETYSVCNFDEDYNWRFQMHTNLFNGMVSILEEISMKEQQHRIDLLPLSNDVGQWDIIYGDGLVYKYTEYHNMPAIEDDHVQDSKPGFDSCPSFSYYTSKLSADDELAYLL